MPKYVVTLTVETHDAGRWTLKQQINNAMPDDLKGPLFGNTDPADFYRAVAHKIADLAAAEDYRIIFKDSAD
jgi:hypothetical protein